MERKTFYYKPLPIQPSPRHPPFSCRNRPAAAGGLLNWQIVPFRLQASGFRLQASEDFPTRGAGGHRSYRSYRSYKTYGLVPTHAELPGYPLDFARGKPATGYQLPATGYWLPATGYWLPATGYHPHRTATVGRMWRRKKSMAFSGTRSWLMLGMTFVSTWKPLDRRYAMAASVWAVIAPRSPSPT